MNNLEYSCRSKILVFARKNASCTSNFLVVIGNGKVYTRANFGVLNFLESTVPSCVFSLRHSEVARPVEGGGVHLDSFVGPRYIFIRSSTEDTFLKQKLRNRLANVCYKKSFSWKPLCKWKTAGGTCGEKGGSDGGIHEWKNNIKSCLTFYTCTFRKNFSFTKYAEWFGQCFLAIEFSLKTNV